MPMSQREGRVLSQVFTGHRHRHHPPLYCVTPLPCATPRHCATTTKCIDPRQVQIYFPVQYFSLKDHVAYCFPRAAPPYKPDRSTLVLPLSPFRLARPSCNNTDLEVSRNGWTAQHIVALSTTARAPCHAASRALCSPAVRRAV